MSKARVSCGSAGRRGGTVSGTEGSRPGTIVSPGRGGTAGGTAWPAPVPGPVAGAGAAAGGAVATVPAGDGAVSGPRATWRGPPAALGAAGPRRPSRRPSWPRRRSPRRLQRWAGGWGGRPAAAPVRAAGVAGETLPLGATAGARRGRPRSPAPRRAGRVARRGGPGGGPAGRPAAAVAARSCSSWALGSAPRPLAQALDLPRLGEVEQREHREAEDRRRSPRSPVLLDLAPTARGRRRIPSGRAVLGSGPYGRRHARRSRAPRPWPPVPRRRPRGPGR